MRGFRSPLSQLLFCIFLVHSLHALGSESIRWVSFDFPPFEIIDGPDAGTGITDEMRTFTQNGLPNYEHQAPIVVNQARLERLFKKGLSCHPGMIANKNSDSFFYYSIPYSMAYPFVLVTTKKKQKDIFNNASSASLIQALSELNATLTIPSRTLGPVIDNIVKENKGNKNLSVMMSSSSAGNAFEMLTKNRTDYVISYSSEVIYWGRNNTIDQLVFIDIDELKGHFIKGSVGCSKSPKGKKVIEILNVYFKENRDNKEYIEKAFLNWMPAQYHTEFLAEFEKSILHDNISNVAAPPVGQ